MRKIIHHLMATGRGTRDLCGPEGLTTEQFVDAVRPPSPLFQHSPYFEANPLCTSPYVIND
jgi:hypothetical protein